MSATMRQPDHALLIDERLLNTLRTRGPQSLEALCMLADLSWSQVFLAIDRLSRSGAVSLRQPQRCEYHVSLTKAAA